LLIVIPPTAEPTNAPAAHGRAGAQHDAVAARCHHRHGKAQLGEVPGAGDARQGRGRPVVHEDP